MKLISNQKVFTEEFERCSKEYSSIEIYTAWVGNPNNIIPYCYLDNLQKVKVYLGIAFNQSSPEGIQELLNGKHDVRIVKSLETYHPKLYFFKQGEKLALLMGSSNFTYSGFTANFECNILLEGKENRNLIENYLKEIRSKINDYEIFTPTVSWLKAYKVEYDKRQKKLKEVKAKDEALIEDSLAASSAWLATSSWDIYLNRLKDGFKKFEERFGEGTNRKFELFNEYSEELPIPWKPSLFNSIENRRRIIGNGDYGWLGHIGASGDVRRIFSTGSIEEKKAICNSINKIAKLNLPLDYAILKSELLKLKELGPSIKAWGRLLAITRPDIYCTISAPSVRKSLSILLGKSQSYFMTVDGYVDLLKLIHKSPWFNTSEPQKKGEAAIWSRRVAFLDIIFY